MLKIRLKPGETKKLREGVVITNDHNSQACLLTIETLTSLIVSNEKEQTNESKEEFYPGT